MGDIRREPASHDMRLVGRHSLDGRAAYQPVIHHYRRGGVDRWILFCGHHGGPPAKNTLTGAIEPNGTTILDVTDPTRPIMMAHLPGATGMGDNSGAQMVRVVDGDKLPSGRNDAVYLLRCHGGDGHQVFDVAEPSDPVLVSTPVWGLAGTHKSWWEEDTGIAYLVCDGRPEGWRTDRMIKIYDLSDPSNPRFIRNFGLSGTEPGSQGPPLRAAGAPIQIDHPGPGGFGVHGPIAFGNRVYIPYGVTVEGIIQIVDREKLLFGNPTSVDPFSDSPENLDYPVVGRLDMPAFWGAHTSFPLMNVSIPDYAQDQVGSVRDFLIVTSEVSVNKSEPAVHSPGFRHATFFVEITDDSKPFPVSNFQVPESNGNYITKGGRFGPHATSESMGPPFYPRVVAISYFNAGVRLVDCRNPYQPVEVAHFVPEPNDLTTTTAGATVAQSNNVEYDDRGYIYLVDRANSGLHILELTGEARRIAFGT